MSDQLIDIRTPLAVSKHARIEVGQDGIVHVLAGPVTLHMERAICEELATTLARAMVLLERVHPREKRPALSVIEGGADAEGNA